MELTQETYPSSDRASRGGCYGNSGSQNPVTYRSNDRPTYSHSVLASRPVLYIK